MNQFEIRCSRCGKSKRVRYDNFVKTSYEWKSGGGTLICPRCAKECSYITGRDQIPVCACVIWSPMVSEMMISVPTEKGKTMDDLIRRKTITNDVCDACNKQFSDEPCEPAECLILQAISDVPAVEAEPVNKDGCEYCQDCGFTEEPFTVITHRGREINVIFNYCPLCGRNLYRDEGEGNV